MNDFRIVEMGKRCAELNKLAQELETKIDNEIVKKLGYKNVKDFEEKTDKEYENDVIIDSLHHDFKFTAKTLKQAVGFVESLTR